MRKTILIVEDEKALRVVLQDVLEQEGFSILEAENGKEGVMIALHKHPDLILLDLLMPEMNGTDALAKIRKDDWGAKVPVIVFTNLSADNPDLIESMVRDRPISYLIKSDWKLDDIVDLVKEVLK